MYIGTIISSMLLANVVIKADIFLWIACLHWQYHPPLSLCFISLWLIVCFLLMYLLFKLVSSLWITGIFEGWLPTKVMRYSNRIVLPSIYHFVLTESFWLKTNTKQTKITNICEIPQLKLSGLKNNLLFFCRVQWKVKEDLYFRWLFSCPSCVDARAFTGKGGR